MVAKLSRLWKHDAPALCWYALAATAVPLLSQGVQRAVCTQADARRGVAQLNAA